MAAVAPDDLWGDFDADVASQPDVGVDWLSSWSTILFFYAFLPIHLLMAFLAFKLPTLQKWFGGALIAYCQSGVNGGPDKRNPFLVAPAIWATLVVLISFIVRLKGQRYRLYDAIHEAGGGNGWGYMAEGLLRMGYEARPNPGSKTVKGWQAPHCLRVRRPTRRLWPRTSRAAASSAPRRPTLPTQCAALAHRLLRSASPLHRTLVCSSVSYATPALPRQRAP